MTGKVDPDLSLRLRQIQYPWAFNRGAGINKNVFPGEGRGQPPSPPHRPFACLSACHPSSACHNKVEAIPYSTPIVLRVITFRSTSGPFRCWHGPLSPLNCVDIHKVFLPWDPGLYTYVCVWGIWRACVNLRHVSHRKCSKGAHYGSLAVSHWSL